MQVLRSLFIGNEETKSYDHKTIDLRLFEMIKLEKKQDLRRCL